MTLRFGVHKAWLFRARPKRISKDLLRLRSSAHFCRHPALVAVHSVALSVYASFLVGVSSLLQLIALNVSILRQIRRYGLG